MMMVKVINESVNAHSNSQHTDTGSVLLVCCWRPVEPVDWPTCLPQFLYALPRQEGYEFFVGQWSKHELHFTSLINLQVRNMNSIPPVHHSDCCVLKGGKEHSSR